MNNSTGIDTWGPWFDGVKCLKNKNTSAVDVEAAKTKDIAIVGAGMAGLMTYLVLHQAGMRNIKTLEGRDRLGGRVLTEFLSTGSSNHSYQEMGAMRVPYHTVFNNITYNITDHQLMFQLGREMNELNGGDKSLSVTFVPFIENSPNGLEYFNGEAGKWTSADSS